MGARGLAPLGFATLLACSGDPYGTLSTGTATGVGAGPASTTVASSSASASSSSGVGGGGAGGGGGAPSPPSFAAPTVLSTAGDNAFAPSLAVRADGTLIAWHEFTPAGAAQVAFAVAVGGVPGTTVVVPETLASPKDAWVAATTAGYVLAYEAFDGTANVVRAVELDPTGAITQGPDTISTPSVDAEFPHVAAFGDQEAFAWTEGLGHAFAMRGPSETVAPTPVGTTLLSTTILNFPRIALAPDGTLFLAYRDGGTDSTDWDVLLVTRPPGGAFGAPVDVSKSPGLLSDDISLAIEADGTLDLAWVDQNSLDVDAFEVARATRSPSGTLAAPALYGVQGLWTWTPSIVPGLAAVWYAGTGASGPFYFGSPTVPPSIILDGATGSHPALGKGLDGTFQLAVELETTPTQVAYARSSSAP